MHTLIDDTIISIVIFCIGILWGIFLAVLCVKVSNYAVKNLARTFINIINRQMKIFNRQGRILYILRIRYKDKTAIKMFNIGNKTK